MNPQLLRLSELAINGHILHKLDLIGSVTIENRPYFTVYRRYNNIHEMVVVDYNGDIYLQKDLSFSESLCRILCLSKERMAQARIQSLLSFKHHAEPPSGYHGFLEKTWSEIHELWFGVSISLAGLFDTETSSSSSSPSEPSLEEKEEIPSVSPSPSPSPSPSTSSSSYSDMEQGLVDFLIELKAPSASNPIYQDNKPIKQESILIQNQTPDSKDPAPIKTEYIEPIEEKKRTSSSLSPPSSPRLTSLLSHQMIHRNGRELRRKIT